jgi:hypothetical protein
MDKPLVSGNKDRNATILLRCKQPLNPAWSDQNTTLVRLPVLNTPTKSSTRIAPPKFLDGFHSPPRPRPAREIEQDPSKIFNEPLRYQNPSEDNYFVLYAEGYEPDHPLAVVLALKRERKYIGLLKKGSVLFLKPGCR